MSYSHSLDGIKMDAIALDRFTRENSAFKTYKELINAKGGYRPTMYVGDPGKQEWADAYDKTQAKRADSRRVYRVHNRR